MTQQYAKAYVCWYIEGSTMPEMTRPKNRVRSTPTTTKKVLIPSFLTGWTRGHLTPSGEVFNDEQVSEYGHVHKGEITKYVTRWLQDGESGGKALCVMRVENMRTAVRLDIAERYHNLNP